MTKEKQIKSGDIFLPFSSEYVDVLGCDAMWTHRQIPAFKAEVGDSMFPGNGIYVRVHITQNNNMQHLKIFVHLYSW
jgi:hypothetical protein